MNTSAFHATLCRAFGCFIAASAGSCAQRSDNGGGHQGAIAPASASAASLPSNTRRAPGENPFGLPATPTFAQAGDFALVPSRSSLNQAFEQAAGKQTLLYTGAYVDRPGERDSALVWLTQQRGSVPNSLLIALPRGERARLSDIVLTSSLSGSGLSRAIVVSGGESDSPEVRSLDLPLDGIAIESERQSTLPKNTFRVLRKPAELGTTLACRRGERRERFLLVAIAGDDTWLGLGFAGRAELLRPSACRALPLVPAVHPGQHVFVPIAGEFVAADVASVDTRNGRVLVRYEFAAEAKELAVGYTNVATELPP
jgi:hypothetical protein